jgi:hypothetical protein
MRPDDDERLKEAFNTITTAMVDVVKVARACPELTPEMVRDQVAPMVETAIQQVLAGMKKQIDETFNSAFEIAANLVSRADVISGAKAAAMIRELKEGPE